MKVNNNNDDELTAIVAISESIGCMFFLLTLNYTKIRLKLHKNFTVFILHRQRDDKE